MGLRLGFRGRMAREKMRRSPPKVEGVAKDSARLVKEIDEADKRISGLQADINGLESKEGAGTVSTKPPHIFEREPLFERKPQERLALVELYEELQVALEGKWVSTRQALVVHKYKTGQKPEHYVTQLKEIEELLKTAGRRIKAYRESKAL